ncbi:ferredoxin-NADP+ reductase [Streptomyces pristinaespiralis ATCC 25486]|uniref:Ferredoxin-NADP+ reductase n=1 Tax=Streptomyces pristinaespiralis (strain ATCC 25486 / DSM 40338 / CBS 914.69 / JCM 4507 / KCC S-0507 / NBRC 13074 / NRRL 2958 / 5647) TaxID=457429 RepID=D6X5U7_STRE2|nr:ferredoxin-NADP+ reductase [Streptomyces pristinaespiralis ATCC 25486]
MPAPARPAKAFQRLVRSRNRQVVDASGLAAIERAEVARGRREGRPRVKLATVAELVKSARSGRRLIPR